MSPRYRHHGSHGRRFGRGRTTTMVMGTPYEETVLLDCVRDIDGLCVYSNAVDFESAGDILPTFVTPEDARHYIDETDSGYARLDSAILASTVADDFKVSWGIQLATWKAFALSAKPSVGWLNTTAVMQQTDRFNEQLKNWFAGFQAVGGKPPGPPPITPGQGVPDPHPTTIGDVTTLALVLGGVAALVIFGPKISRLL